MAFQDICQTFYYYFTHLGKCKNILQFLFDKSYFYYWPELESKNFFGTKNKTNCINIFQSLWISCLCILQYTAHIVEFCCFSKVHSFWGQCRVLGYLGLLGAPVEDLFFHNCTPYCPLNCPKYIAVSPD